MVITVQKLEGFDIPEHIRLASPEVKVIWVVFRNNEFHDYFLSPVEAEAKKDELEKVALAESTSNLTSEDVQEPPAISPSVPPKAAAPTRPKKYRPAGVPGLGD